MERVKWMSRKSLIELRDRIWDRLVKYRLQYNDGDQLTARALWAVEQQLRQEGSEHA